MNGKIAFIGAGNMAGAFAGGLVSSGMDPQLISLSAPHMEKLEALRKKLGVSVTTSNAESVRDADTIVLAVKPQVMEKCLTELMKEIGSVEESSSSASPPASRWSGSRSSSEGTRGSSASCPTPLPSSGAA